MKKLVSCLFFVFVAVLMFGQVTNNSFGTASWKMLDNAERAFDEGDLTTALKLAENARQARSEEFTNAASIIESALVPTAVQRCGDLITDVRAIWEERKEIRALAVLNDALLLHSQEDFNYSITAVCNYYRSRIAYPEAEYLLGKIYMLEGEYDIADSFYSQAIEHADVLDVPENKITILYDEAYLARLRGDWNGYEEKLLMVMENNPDYMDYLGKGTSSAYLAAIIRATRRNFTADKFFMLYRSTAYDTMAACINLAEYYNSNDYDDKAYPVSVLAVLTSFTRIHGILIQRNMNYTYSTLESFFDETARYSDIQKWMKDNDVWKGFYVFGKLLAEYQGNVDMAKNIFETLTEKCPDSYVKNAASTQLALLNQ